MYHNAQAVRVLRGSLSTYEYNKVRGLDSVKEIWDTLKMSHEVSEEVHESKIDLIQGELEAFVMNKDEMIEKMYNRLKLLIIEIRGLRSKDWDDAKVTKKPLSKKRSDCNLHKKQPPFQDYEARHLRKSTYTL